MNCQEVRELIIAQTGRQAPAPEMERHLWACSSCSQVYLEQQALWRQMDAWEPPEISPDFDRRLFARIGSAAGSWVGLNRLGLDWLSRPFHPFRPAFSLALACVLLVATVVVERGRHTPVPADAGLAINVMERDDPRQIDRALDDIQMLSEFEILPLEQAGEGRS
jgi:hypothetical protein